MNRAVLPIAAGGIVVLAISAVGIAVTHRRAVDAEKALEAAEAREADLIVATTTTTRVLEQKAEALHDEIERLRKVVPSAKVREVVRWRTGEIRVQTETALGMVGGTLGHEEEGTGMGLVVGEAEALDCPIPAEVAFELRGAEARLESDAGNFFAVGSVELWRTDPPPPTKLGEAEFKTDATTFDIVAQEPDRRLRHAIGVGWRFDNAPVVRYQYAVTRRWAVWGEASRQAAAGVEFRW